MRRFVTAAIIGVLALAGPTLASSAANGGLTASDRTGEEEEGLIDNFLPIIGGLLALAGGITAGVELIDIDDTPVSP